MMKSCSCGICCIVGIITAIGAINWGLVAGFNFNLVAKIAGTGTTAERVIYIVVGIARMRVVRLESDLDGRRFRVGAAFVDLDPVERDFIVRAIDRVNLRAMLSQMLERNASDMHLTVGYPPVFRTHRKLIPLDLEPL